MDLYQILFLVLAVALIGGVVTLLVSLSRATKERVDQARAELKRNGFVRDLAQLRPLGTLTRIWGKLPKATPLYLQISDFDPLSVAVGNSGLFDIKVGDPEFDVSFVVRSNNKDKAIQVLTTSIRKNLLEFKGLRFRTGSVISLLGVDYFPEVKEKELRNFWMIEQRSELDPVQTKRLHSLAEAIISELNQVCKDWVGEQKLKTTFFEGR